MGPPPSPPRPYYLCLVSLSFLPFFSWGGKVPLQVPHPSSDTPELSRGWGGMEGHQPGTQGSVLDHTPALPPLGSLAVFISGASSYSEILVNVCLHFESQELVSWEKETREDRENCVTVVYGCLQSPSSALVAQGQPGPINANSGPCCHLGNRGPDGTSCAWRPENLSSGLLLQK